jgi:septal ring factor EnvC (AmiA/AmiB activator)
MTTDMNPEKILQACDALEAQQYGLFPWLKQAREIADYFRQQAKEVATMQAALTATAQALAQKRDELADVESTIREKRFAEEARQRKEIDTELADVKRQVAAEIQRKQTATAEADKAEARLRTVQDHIAKLGLAPVGA